MSQKKPLGGSLVGCAVVTIAGLMVTGVAGAQGRVGVDAEGEYVKGRVIVLPRGGVAAEEVAAVAGSLGARSRAIGSSGLHVLELPAGTSETAVAQRLARNPKFKFAELDRRFRAAFTPNDPLLANQWHTARVNAAAAWDYGQGAGVTIAILDSGVDGSHPDLSARMVPGWNVIDNNSNTSDVQGHGTAVAGAAAATINNATGYAGIAGQARIMPIRIANADLWADASVLATGITVAADKGARVASISYSGTAGNSTVQAAADYMRSKGGLVVVSAGNSGSEQATPATTKVIPVSATDRTDALASFSSWGSFVAIAAPGVDVACTAMGGTYGWCNGTSLSTPLVAGTLAAMMSANAGLPNTQIESLLFSTAVDLGSAGRDKYFGYGLVNAGAAVSAAARASVTADTTKPQATISSPTAGSLVAGSVAVTVAATDNVGVSKVELFANGRSIGVDTAAPFSFAWDTLQFANGSVTLTAVAYDAAGNAGSSAGAAVNVANNVGVVADTMPPTVAITNPGGGATVKGTVDVRVSASDNAGTATLSQQLYLDGKLVKTATGVGSMSYSWNTRKASPGTHTLEAVARDGAGNVTSTAVQVRK